MSIKWTCLFDNKPPKTSSLYDKACVLFDVPDNVKKSICIIANDIDTEILNVEAGGIEDTSHITVLYGVKATMDLSKYFKKPILLKTDTKITYFDNEDASVAKVAIFSDEIQDLHYLIKSFEPNSDDRLDYNPHITIAYLKPNKRLENDGFVSFSWVQRSIELRFNGLVDKIQI
jgi:hypothetical protein